MSTFSGWPEGFLEEYPITLFEEQGGTYIQKELLHKGRHGDFFSCTMSIGNFIYDGISYIGKNGIRAVYSLASYTDNSGKTIHKNAENHFQHTITDIVLNQMDETSWKRMSCYLVLHTISFLLPIISVIFLILAICSFLSVLVVHTAFFLFGAVMLILISKLLTRYRKFAF